MKDPLVAALEALDKAKRRKCSPRLLRTLEARVRSEAENARAMLARGFGVFDLPPSASTTPRVEQQSDQTPPLPPRLRLV